MRIPAIVLGAVLLVFLSALSYAQAPVPLINLPLVPDATPPGGGDFTLTVNGTGFVSDSVVNWNGGALATQFVSGSQLTAIVPAVDIAAASSASVMVVNPSPGGGKSNVAFFTATADAGDSIFFSLFPPPATGSYPSSVAVGDFNGDGKLDLAVTDMYSNTVYILLGDGNGNFTLASSPAVGTQPTSVAVGDFNGDGKLDLAVANQGNGSVSILLGDGTGNFTLASSPSFPPYGVPSSMAVGDFNGDGKLDLAVAIQCGVNGNCSSPATVAILLGDGTGNFTLASSPTVGPEAKSVAAGDFNGDGKLDLAVANGSNTVSILLGDGTGNFTLASSPATGPQPQSIAVGDFNGDGKLDLAVATCNADCVYAPGEVSILLGDGTGNFTLASSPGTDPGGPYSIAAADLNGDGTLDLAVTTYGFTISILMGDGAGNFTPAASVNTGYYGTQGLAMGDFNGDGKMDLAVTDSVYNKFFILLQVPPTTVTLSPAALNFGTQLRHTTSNPQSVLLSNVGNVVLSISSIAASYDFSETNNCGSSLAVGASCTIIVTFAPSLFVGPLTGTVTITDNAFNSPQTVSLTGVSTVVTLLPPSLNFGNQNVGTTSQPQTVTFTNYAKLAVSFFGVRFTGTNPAAFTQSNTCGTSVPAGGRCTISVTFTPHGKGPKTATLDVGDNGGASPQAVALSGTGT